MGHRSGVMRSLAAMNTLVRTVLALCLLCRHADGLSVILDNPSLLPVEGSTRVLDCELEELHVVSTESIHWIRNSIRIKQSPKYAGVTTEHLQINNLDPSDDGRFACVVTHSGGRQSISPALTLTVRYGYETKVESRDEHIPEPTEGSKWQLFCEITRQGYPQDIIQTTWYHNGEKLPDIFHNQGISYSGQWAKLGTDMHLLNKELSRNDSGEYRCEVDNGINGGRYEPVQVNVAYPLPDKPVIWVDSVPGNAVVDVQEAQMVQLRCHFSHLGYPPANDLVYDWYEDNQAFKMDAKSNVINIPTNVVGIKKISCLGKSETKMSNPASYVTITMEAPPTVNKVTVTSEMKGEVEEVSLTCTMSGSHVDNITWLRNSKPLTIQNGIYTTQSSLTQGSFAYGQKSANQSTLTIHVPPSIESCGEIYQYDGQYSCQGEGHAGEERTTVQSQPQAVSIKYSPLINRTTPTALRRSVGDRDVALYCGICANPMGTVRWHLKGRSLPYDVVVQNTRIVIPEVESKHFGRYTCIMENRSANKLGHKKWRQEFSISLFNTNGQDIIGASFPDWALVLIILLLVLIMCGMITLLCYVKNPPAKTFINKVILRRSKRLTNDSKDGSASFTDVTKGDANPNNNELDNEAPPPYEEGRGRHNSTRSNGKQRPSSLKIEPSPQGTVTIPTEQYNMMLDLIKNTKPQVINNITNNFTFVLDRQNSKSSQTQREIAEEIIKGMMEKLKGTPSPSARSQNPLTPSTAGSVDMGPRAPVLRSISSAEDAVRYQKAPTTAGSDMVDGNFFSTVNEEVESFSSCERATREPLLGCQKDDVDGSNSILVNYYNMMYDYEEVRFNLVTTTDYYRAEQPYKLFNITSAEPEDCSSVDINIDIPETSPDYNIIVRLNHCRTSEYGMVDIYFNDMKKPLFSRYQEAKWDGFGVNDLVIEKRLFRKGENRLTIILNPDSEGVYWLSDVWIYKESQ